MRQRTITRLVLFPCVFITMVISTGCGSSPGSSQPSTETSAVQTGLVSQNNNTSQNTSANQCNSDPRVVSGILPLNVCQGGWIFFNETFNGNGRTCGTCHPAENNYTIDEQFISALPPDNKIFYAFQPSHTAYSAFYDDPNLDVGKPLETEALHSEFALIKVHVDGFDNIEYKYVSRAVPHLLSLATSIARDPGDHTGSEFVERIGWSGDGSPDNGSLRSFLNGGIEQHLTRDNERVPDRSFRYANEAEKDQMLAFLLALGRTSDINLSLVTLTDSEAAMGKTAYMDPRNRCNHCHNNAGANFALTGLNRNFNTGTVNRPTASVHLPNGANHFDGGFGGKDLLAPNFTVDSAVPDAFGDGSFNVPSIIEAADTGPFFHNHFAGASESRTNGIEKVVSFYGSGTFRSSPAALELDSFFGVGIDITPVKVVQIGRFLRVLNVAFNLAMAIQRLQAAYTLTQQYSDSGIDIQKGLLKLADAEIEDALLVLSSASSSGSAPLHTSQQILLQNARGMLADAMQATSHTTRLDRTAAALSAVEVSKAALGTGMNFVLGPGNLMF
jgi:cytochrome c peroxidase